MDGIGIIFLFVQILKLSIDVTILLLSLEITLKILMARLSLKWSYYFMHKIGCEHKQQKSAMLSNVACILSFAKSSQRLGTMC